MRHPINFAGLFAAAAALLSVPALPASAENAKPRIAVPSPANGVQGCWTADRNLYGPYRIGFCINRDGGGSYTVRGGGLYCSAGLSWQQNWGGGYGFHMHRAHCGRGTDWTADSFSCRLQPVYGNRAEQTSDRPRIMVPAPAQYELVCRYQPAVWGYPATAFTASRS